MHRHNILLLLFLLPSICFSQTNGDIKSLFNDIINERSGNELHVIELSLISISLKDFYGDSTSICENTNEIVTKQIAQDCYFKGKTIDYSIDLGESKFDRNPFNELRKFTEIDICEMNQELRGLDSCNYKIIIDWKDYNSKNKNFKFTNNLNHSNLLVISRPIFTKDKNFAVIKIYTSNKVKSIYTLLIFNRDNDLKWKQIDQIYGG